jgi:hypothetical protein
MREFIAIKREGYDLLKRMIIIDFIYVNIPETTSLTFANYEEHRLVSGLTHVGNILFSGNSSAFRFASLLSISCLVE